jgi:hypothetical protein
MLFAEYGTPAEWSVAGGTLLLALATFALAMNWNGGDPSLVSLA